MRRPGEHRRRPLVVRALVAEATSGITVLSGLVAVVAMLLTAASADFTGILPGGANTLNLPLALCYLVAPLTGGMAAVRTGRALAQGALDLAATTPRGRAALLLQIAAAYVGWAMLAYLCGVVVVVHAVGLGGPWPPGATLLVVDALALNAAFVLIGVGVGSRVSSVLVGPALTLAGLVVLTDLNNSSGVPGRFSPIFGGTFYGYGTQPNVARVAGVILVVVAIAVLVAGLGCYPRTTVRVGAAVVALALLAGGGARVLTAPAQATQARTGSAGSCATHRGIELCLWSGPGVDVDRVLRPLVEVRAVAATFTPEPTRFHEAGLDNGPGFTTISVAPPSPEESYVSTARAAVLPEPCSEATRRDQVELAGLLNERLHPGSGAGSAKPYSTGVALARRSLAAQRAWAAPRIAALRACD